MNLLSRLYHLLVLRPYYRSVLGRLGSRSKLIQPTLTGPGRIFIGSGVFVRRHGWLAADPVTGTASCKLEIGDGCYLGQFCHIYASGSITLGRNVLLADRVYISDNVHGYEDVTRPVMDQPVKQLAPVVIGDGAWLGENVCVIGASVGRNSVVGANAVVTRSIPDFCVAVGSPARIIKRYDPDLSAWRKTDPEGHFI